MAQPDNLPSSVPSYGPWIRLRFRLNETFAQGTAAILIWLSAMTMALVLIAATVLSLVKASIDEKHPGSFVEAFWASLLRTLDPGTMGDDVGWDLRIVSLCVTLVGIFFVSTLIGLIATGLDRSLRKLQEGRGVVPERGHTVVIGHTSMLPTVLEELIEANASERHACVTVLGSRPLPDISAEIRARIPDSRSTRLVFRTGDGSNINDLALVNPLAARSVIVLADDGSRSDAFSIRSVLALMTFDPTLHSMRIVVQCHDPKSAAALDRVTEGRVTTVVSDEIIGRLAAQSCRQRGLSTIYQELFDFTGSEIYFAEFPELVAHTFAHAAVSFDRTTIIGVRRHDGRVLLAPDPDGLIEAGDALIGVAEDDSTFVLTHVGPPAALPGASVDPTQAQRPVEHFLITGWSRIGPTILEELDQYVSPGSTIRITADPRHCVLPRVSDFAHLANLTISVNEMSHHDTDSILTMWTAQRPDHVLLLSYRDRLSVSEADAEILLALLQLRHAVRIHGGISPPTIITELLDARDVPLAHTSGADDFIVSERLTGLILTQLAENPELDEVFEDLLDVDGAEIHLQPAPVFADGSAPRTFRDLTLLGLARGDVVLGYRSGSIPEGVESLPGGIVINPPKDSPVRLETDDRIVVITRR